MSAIPNWGRSKDGYTRRDCVHAVFAGGGRVCCDMPCVIKATDGYCIGRKLCINFKAVKLEGGRHE